MATRNFKPKASSNIIEGATPVEEQIPVEEQTTVAPVEEEKVVEATATPVEEETAVTDKAEVSESKEDAVETTTPTVTFEDKSSKKTPIEKNVKIRTKVNHSCCIGGVRYHFEKGKQVNVPESVKAILLQADLLMPL